jgi:ferredoxin-type protein NapF
MSVDVSRRNFLLGRPSRCRPGLTVAVGDGCLARRHIVCRSCGEICDADAIRMSPGLNGVAVPVIVADRCTGCGDCIDICPAQALHWSAT